MEARRLVSRRGAQNASLICTSVNGTARSLSSGAAAGAMDGARVNKNPAPRDNRREECFMLESL